MNTSLIVRVAAVVAFTCLVGTAIAAEGEHLERLQYVLGWFDFKVALDIDGAGLGDGRFRVKGAFRALVHWAIIVGFVAALLPGKEPQPIKTEAPDAAAPGNPE